MTIHARFKKHPLALALQVPAFGLLVLGASFTHATTTLHPGLERTIDSGTRIDDWVISQNAHLTSNGAQLRQSRVTAGALTLNAGTKAQDIYATQGSQINLNGATVEARNSAAFAINLQGSHAQIKGSQVINNNGVGLLAARNLLTEDGSTATVFDSTIVGSSEGARATTFSQLNFFGSDVIATDENGIGVHLWGGAANAVGGTISKRW
ncbi:hypothetical protein QF045_003491 [Pseudomonas sp. W4I3]|nr:hypothetical protein [Pseudomonas sp. W4I3]MDQ0740631.1 hypothetical protein [Pseudomonas sp. W4I3]